MVAGNRLQGALADPVKALHAATEASPDEATRGAKRQESLRVAALVARAIRARNLSMLDVWLASLGPVTSALLEAAVRSAIRRTPPPPPKPKKQEPTVIAGYERENRPYVTIGVGCTGGKHRSVAVTEDLVKRLVAAGASATAMHRDLGKE